MEADELDLVTTDDLFAALARRSHSVILSLYIRQCNDRSRLVSFHAGDPVACIGALECARDELLRLARTSRSRNHTEDQ